MKFKYTVMLICLPEYDIGNCEIISTHNDPESALEAKKQLEEENNNDDNSYEVVLEEI